MPSYEAIVAFIDSALKRQDEKALQQIYWVIRSVAFDFYDGIDVLREPSDTMSDDERQRRIDSYEAHLEKLDGLQNRFKAEIGK